MKNTIKTEFKVLGIIAGIALIIMGFILAFTFDASFNGSYALDCEFGGDYYTEQYGATQKVTKNLYNLGEYTEQAIAFAFKMSGLITIALGIVVISYFGCKVNISNNVSPSSSNSTNDESVFKNIKSEE